MYARENANGTKTLNPCRTQNSRHTRWHIVGAGLHGAGSADMQFETIPDAEGDVTEQPTKKRKKRRKKPRGGWCRRRAVVLAQMTLTETIAEWGLPPCDECYCALCNAWIHPAFDSYVRHIHGKKHRKHRHSALYILLALVSEP